MGTAILQDGQGSITTSELAIGSHTIIATYIGDSNYQSSTGSVNHDVDPAATTTALQTSANPAIVSQEVTFTATVTTTAPGSGTPVGSVRFFDDTTDTDLGTVFLDENGQASLTTAALGFGSHTIVATYLGDTNFLGNSSSVSQTVTLPTPLALALFNTGTDADGDVVTGNPSELHYTVEYFETPGQIEAPEANPTPPGGGLGEDAFVASNQYYLADDGTSRWVTPYSTDTNRIDPVGLYLWTTHFTVPNGIDASALTVIGQWSSDNQGVGIYLNGELTDNPATGHDAFQGLHEFTLTGLLSGDNVLQFLVFNSPVGGETLNPTALRVQFDSVTLGNASASAVGLFATGVDENGAAVSGTGPDLHYTVTLPDGTAGTAFAAAHPNYLPDSSISRWLMLDADAQQGQPVGTYLWTTHFTIADGTNLGQLVLNGRWASDNAGIDILINGVSTSSSHADETAFDAWSSFALTGPFHEGDNVIQFVVDNAAGSGANPTALRLEFTSVFLGT